jgi:hypothetical protein
VKRHTLGSILSNVKRKLFAPHHRRPRPIHKRPGLELLRLEDRIVPQGVAPGAYWDDGYFQNGIRVGMTVTLHNFGSGWLEVSGGGGSVSVSPGAPPPPPDDSGGSDIAPTEPPLLSGSDSGGGDSGGDDPPPPSNAYGFEVNGLLGAGSGDVTWSGAADGLYIKTTGDVSPVSISGDVSIQAGESIGDVAGHNVTAWAGTSVGSVTASGDIYYVVAGQGQNVGALQAGGFISSVQAGNDISGVQAGTWIGWVWSGHDITGAVTAGGDIGGPHTLIYWLNRVDAGGPGIYAGHDIVGPITAGATLFAAAAGHDVLGAVNAGLDLSVTAGAWSIYLFPEESQGPPEPGNVVGAVSAGRDVAAVSATGDITGNITAGRSIAFVSAKGMLSDSITAGAGIGEEPPSSYPTLDLGLHAGKDVNVTATAAAGPIFAVTAGGKITGTFNASGDIGIVRAAGSISATLTGGGDVGPVTAGSLGDDYWSDPPETPPPPADITGNISAGHDLKSAAASGNISSDLHAGHSIGSVQASKSISSSITAGAAIGLLTDDDTHVGTTSGDWPTDPFYGYNPTAISAGDDISGSVTAGTDITSISTGKKLMAPISAGRDIGRVHTPDDLNANVTAGRDIGSVSAGTSSNSTPAAMPAKLTGTINAGHDIGKLYALGDVDLNVTAGRDIGSVSAGGPYYNLFGGSAPAAESEPAKLAGTITAGRDIDTLYAPGDVDVTVSAGGDIGSVKTGTKLAGTITAGGDLNLLFAPGDIDATVNVTGTILDVKSGGIIDGTIDAGSDIGDVTYEYWEQPYWHGIRAASNIHASISAGGHIFLVEAGVSLYGGTNPGGDITGDISAGGDIDFITAHRSPASPDDGGSGSPGDEPPDSSNAPTNGNISGAIDAGGDIWSVGAGGSVLGGVTADGSIDSVAALGGTIDGSIDAGLGIGLVEALGSAGAAFAPVVPARTPTGSDSDWVRPARPTLADDGTISGSVTAGGGIGTVVAFGELSGAIHAGMGVWDVWAAGDITGGVTTDAGAAKVETWGELSSGVTAPGGITAWAYEDLAGGLQSDEGKVSFGSWADATGTVDAGADAVGFAFNSMLVTGSTPDEEAASASEDSPEDITRAEIKAKGDINLTAGRDIDVDYLTSKEGSITADAGRSVGVKEATAGKNLWVSARLGSLLDVVGDDGWGSVSGKLTAQDGWAYVWAARDISGSVDAKKTVSVTAWQDLNASLTSSDEGVEAWAGRNLSGDVSGKWRAEVEARGDIGNNESPVNITVGDDETSWGEATVRAGGTINATVSATGSADVTASGKILADITATHGWLNAVANSDIHGTLKAGEQADVWAGGKVDGEVTAGLDVHVRASGYVRSPVTSLNGNVSVHAGGDLYGSIDARGGDAVVEVAGGIFGDPITITAKHDVSVVAAGDIQASVEGEWIADVRSTGGQVTGIVSTRNTNLTDPASPTSRRMAVIDAKIAQVIQVLGTITSETSRTYYEQQLTDLRAEKELLTFQGTTNLARIPADRIRALLAAGQAKEWQGKVDIGDPGSPDLKEATGYVVMADVVGNQISIWVLEPWWHIVWTDGNSTLHEEESKLIGDTSASAVATYYKTVWHYNAEYSNMSLEDALARARSDARALAEIKQVLIQIESNRLESLTNVLNFGVRLIPLVGAIDQFVQGDYLEGALSLASDAAMFLGIGAAFKARNCTYAGNRLVKLASAGSATIEIGVAGVRIGQGIHALGGNSGDAWGYFGDALLRLLGLSAQACSFLKKRKCFVAGTPVHTEDGPKPIEQVEVGERVWAFDRQLQQWELCRVTQTFQRRSDQLTTVRFDDGDEVTGTDGHPFWVIEGEDLANRPAPDHGAKENAGRTPGRWVGMAALRSGDAVLARQGRVRRVVSVQTRREVVPVYNLEVQGLHCYAVGQVGLLVHNADGYPDGLQTVAAEVAESSPSPAAKVSNQGATPEVTKPSVAKQVGAEDIDGATKLTKPAADPPSTSSSQRNRPRSNDDPKVAYKYQVEKHESPKFTPADDAALKSAWEQYEAAQAAGQSLNKLGRELGEAGAAQYMEGHLQATQVYKQTTTNGNWDLDFVYKKGDQYYVVEAKSPNARPTVREAGVNPDTNQKIYSIEGNDKYLRDTIDRLENFGNDLQIDIASQLQEALANGKVIYLEVATRKSDLGHNFFAVRTFKL